MERRFNLVDEGWIPVEGQGRVSLEDVFSDTTLKSLGGTAVQKLAILKLLLAIAHTVITPEDDDEWRRLGSQGLGVRCVDYLREKKELFYLYGDKPFLQMPVLRTLSDTKKKEPLKVSVIGRNYIPDLPSDNDTILFQTQIDHPLDDAERAVFIISLMNYSLGGKRITKDVPPLTKGFSSKSSSAKAAPSLGGYVGYLNSCLWGMSILETVWLNLFTREALGRFRSDWRDQAIIPPWELMPAGEDDEIARSLKNGYMGTLIAMSRFVLLEKEGVIYSEGIQYPYHKNGWREPFLAFADKDKMLWLDTAKRPWRNLTALLSASFLKGQATFQCPQINELLLRAREAQDTIGIWSGGLKVRGNAGDQSVKQTDDYIESLVFLNTSSIGDPWFIDLSSEMEELNKLSSNLYKSIKSYFNDLMTKNDDLLKKALEEFWMLAEPLFQEMVEGCEDIDRRFVIRKKYALIAQQIYDHYCSNASARQMSAWAKNRVNVRKYLSKVKKEV